MTAADRDSIAMRLRGPALGVVLSTLAAAALPALAGSVPTGKPEDVGMSSERLARVHEVVQEHVDAGNVAGVVTLVARRGKIVHFEAQGYANLESRTPMRTDNIFRLASMGKPITAVAVMMLVEEGKIRLNDPVARFIPEFSTLNKVAVPKEGGAEGAYDLVDVSRPDHGARLADPRLGPPERRARPARRGPGRAARAGRHARDLHPEARGRAARLSARHAVALQRSRGVRRAEPHRRGRLGQALRRVSQGAIVRAVGHAGQRLLLHRPAGRARRDDLHASAGTKRCNRTRTRR